MKSQHFSLAKYWSDKSLSAENDNHDMISQSPTYLFSVKPNFTAATTVQKLVSIPLKFHNWYQPISITHVNRTVVLINEM